MYNSHLFTTPEVQPAELIVPAAPRRATMRVSTLRDAANLPRMMLFQERIRLLLDRDRYISTSVYNCENHVHLLKINGHITLREGVALKFRQTRNLFDAIETIDAAADGEWKTLERQKAAYLVSRLGNILESVSKQRTTLLRCSTLLDTAYANRPSSYKDWIEHEHY